MLSGRHPLLANASQGRQFAIPPGLDWVYGQFTRHSARTRRRSLWTVDCTSAGMARPNENPPWPPSRPPHGGRWVCPNALATRVLVLGSGVSFLFSALAFREAPYTRFPCFASRHLVLCSVTRYTGVLALLRIHIKLLYLNIRQHAFAPFNCAVKVSLDPGKPQAPKLNTRQYTLLVRHYRSGARHWRSLLPRYNPLSFRSTSKRHPPPTHQQLPHPHPQWASSTLSEPSSKSTV